MQAPVDDAADSENAVYLWLLHQCRVEQLQLQLYGLVVTNWVRRRPIQHMQQHPASADMSQEGVTQTMTFMSTFQQTRNICRRGNQQLQINVLMSSGISTQQAAVLNTYVECFPWVRVCLLSDITCRCGLPRCRQARTKESRLAWLPNVQLTPLQVPDTQHTCKHCRPVVHLTDTQVWHQSCEGIVCYLGPSSTQHSQQGGLAGIGYSNNTHICYNLHMNGRI